MNKDRVELENEQLDMVTGGSPILIVNNEQDLELFEIENSDPFYVPICTYDTGHDLNGDFPSCSDAPNKGKKRECANCPARYCNR